MTVTIPAGTMIPNNDLVATAFLERILGQSGGVGAKLPGDNSWATTGFVQTSIVGGSGNPYAPTRSPVIGLKCWWQVPGSKQPGWAKANELAERIRLGCFRAQQQPFVVQLPASYPAAYVSSAYLLTEPRRLEGDDSSNACYQFDLQMHWVGAAV